MDVTEYVERVRHELAVAAEVGGPEAVTLAGRLAAPLTSAMRLALFEALSKAADEITRDLAPGSVEVRLRDGEPRFAVTLPATLAPPVAPPTAANPEPDDVPGDPEGATARINFRVPDALKARIEEAAAAQGRSVNAWLTRAATAALRVPGGPGAADRPAPGRSTQHVTGWVR
ncbi:MAG TPA: toxin-antitoxin system HicB family antitoxin [Jatrophihabitans sp.]|nr:toxin-antitoxin system HicB family antitoxin [Jatrophihabitans sp.]